MISQPTYFIPHGGGPCFFMDDPKDVWAGMADFLRDLPSRLPGPPKAILVISGHWETKGFALTGAATPSLIYDYYGFPQHTYALRYDVPGAPALAAKAAKLLIEHNLDARVDPSRGLDHGVFVPLKVAYPTADIPIVEMSIDRDFNPAQHLAAGQALTSLRDEGVLIIASGMSFHNMRGYGDARSTAPSQAFDNWLVDSVAMDAAARASRLIHWADAPSARFSHPREEHLLPLMIAAGAALGPGEQVYSEQVLATAISGFRFD